MISTLNNYQWQLNLFLFVSLVGVVFWVYTLSKIFLQFSLIIYEYNFWNHTLILSSVTAAISLEITSVFILTMSEFL